MDRYIDIKKLADIVDKDARKGEFFLHVGIRIENLPGHSKSYHFNYDSPEKNLGSEEMKCGKCDSDEDVLAEKLHEIKGLLSKRGYQSRQVITWPKATLRIFKK